MVAFIYTSVYIFGLFLARFFSYLLESQDYLHEIRCVAEKCDSKLYQDFFMVMVTFYTSLFSFCYLCITVPLQTAVYSGMGSAQHVVDMTIVYVAMLALELTYVHARYRVMVVVLGSLGGVAWALIMLNAVVFVKWCERDEERNEHAALDKYLKWRSRQPRDENLA